MNCSCQPCYRCLCLEKNIFVRFSVGPLLLLAATTAAAIGIMQMGMGSIASIKHPKSTARKIEVVPIDPAQPGNEKDDKGVPVFSQTYKPGQKEQKK